MPYQGNIDWGASVSHRWRLVRVDLPTWADGDTIPGAIEASVSRDRDGDLLESGSATIAMGVDEEPREFVGRIEVLAEQGSVVERHPVSTMRFIPGRSVLHTGRRVVEYDGYSVLRPADTRKMEAGAYVPKGIDGAAWIARMLGECMKAPVVANESFILTEHYDFSGGSSRLASIWEVLDAVGWCLRIDESGVVTIMPLPNEPSLVLDTANARLLNPELESDDGLADTVNRWIAVDGDNRAEAVDTSDLPTSYTQRGYYVEEYEETPARLDGETLQAYVNRRLEESMNVIGTRTYTRAWIPDVLPFDVVRGSIASVGLDCDMRIKSQTLELGATATVTEVSEVIR